MATDPQLVPTLSELIEAIPGKAKMLLSHTPGVWAYAVDGVGGGGSTPEEAAANLWLRKHNA